MRIHVAVQTNLGEVTVMKALEWGGFHNVYAYSCGQQLIDESTAKPPDLIIIDKQLSSMSGFELARKLPRRQGICVTPLIMLGANFTTDEAEKAACAGIREILVKPISPETLNHKVKAATGVPH